MVYYYVEGDEFPVYADKIICKVNNPVKEEKEQGEKMREQEDIDTYFQATSIKSICDCNAIKELLETKNRCLPHRIIIDTDKGITYHDFTIWLRNKQMPNTYDECCEIMGVNPDIDSQYCSGYIGDDLMELQDLIVCRDAYWKMCNNWQPNWNDDEYKYCIWCNHDEISSFNTISAQYLLTFPTEDIRDLFLKNFQRKIKICKRYI
jgi:hypothetical protein